MSSEVLVTVRMPASLVSALKSRTAAEHYTDFSEQLRSIIRKQSLAYLNPLPRELEQLKEHLKMELLEENERARKEELLASLRELIGGDAS